MKIRMKVSEIPPGSCFTAGRKKTIRKKLDDGTILTVGKNGRVRKSTQKGDPVATPTACPLKYLGAGLLRYPESVIEIGDGRPKRIVRVKLT